MLRFPQPCNVVLCSPAMCCCKHSHEQAYAMLFDVDDTLPPRTHRDELKNSIVSLHCESLSPKSASTSHARLLNVVIMHVSFSCLHLLQSAKSLSGQSASAVQHHWVATALHCTQKRHMYKLLRQTAQVLARVSCLTGSFSSQRSLRVNCFVPARQALHQTPMGLLPSLWGLQRIDQ